MQVAIGYSYHMVTLRHLRYFSAVARHRHFGKAAEECAVSQPALSVQIRDLEESLGVTLIERRRSAIALTGVGHEIERRANAILTAVRDLVDHARRRDAPLSGRLSLGVIPSVAPYLLPAVLPALAEAYPGLDLHLRETTTRELLIELNDGTLDAIIVSLPLDDCGLETMPLFEDRFVLALPAAHRLAAAGRAVSKKPGRGRIPPGELDTADLLLLEEGHCLRDQALAFCGGTADDRRRRFGATSLATIVQMVANGHGATLLPELAVAAEAADGSRIAVMRFTEPEPSRTIGLAWRRSSPRNADFRALGDVIAGAGTRILAGTRLAHVRAKRTPVRRKNMR